MPKAESWLIISILFELMALNSEDKMGDKLINPADVLVSVDFCMEGKWLAIRI